MSDYSDVIDDYRKHAITFHKHLLSNTFLTSVIATITVFFIVKCSPKEMGLYKWYLLSTVIFSTVVDIWLNLFFQPALLLPSGTICVFGLIKQLNDTHLSMIAFVSQVL